MKNLLLPFRTSLHSGRDAGLRTFDEITFSGLRTRLHSGHHGSCIHSEFRKTDQEIKQIKSDQEIKLINWENRNHDDYQDDYRGRDYRRRSRSRDRYTRDRYRVRDYRRRSRSRSYSSPDDYKKHGRDSLSPARRSPSRSRSRSYSPDSLQ